jgi:pyruvate/2-oxoglutarate dehydrogenase complex dihydrolipoamide acyltransferase (E2) component
VEWLVAPGATVERYQVIGTFDRDDWGEEDITSPEDGVVDSRGWVPVGTRVSEGTFLIHIKAAVPVVQQTDLRTPRSAPAHPRSPTRTPVHPPPIVEELTIEPTPSPAPVEEPIRRPKKSAGKDKVKLVGVYLLPKQEDRIETDALLWALDREDPLTTNKSEIVRALLDLYEFMEPAKRRALVEAYKQKERSAGVGGGWPRPGRPRRKKG